MQSKIAISFIKLHVGSYYCNSFTLLQITGLHLLAPVCCHFYMCVGYQHYQNFPFPHSLTCNSSCEYDVNGLSPAHIYCLYNTM